MSSSHLLLGAGAQPVRLGIRQITPTDVLKSLAQGLDDFVAMPSHAIFLCAIYPLVGLWLIALVSGYSMLQLAFPIAAGFALVGPFAAIALYELSRQREAGLDASFSHAFDALKSPSIGAIIAMGLLLMVIFLVWLAVANAIYVANFGYAMPASIGQFVTDVFTTRPGWILIIVGTGIGFLFAALVLTISAVSFPLLLDRDVGAAVALFTSIRVVVANPVSMALWGLIVAVLLAAGSVPFLLGLTVVMPLLGHATWHLYSKALVRDSAPRPDYQKPGYLPPERPQRYAAHFPASLFPTGRQNLDRISAAPSSSHLDNAGSKRYTSSVRVNAARYGS